MWVEPVALSLCLSVLLVWSTWLSYVDVRTRRLPDGLTLPPAAAAVSVTLLLDPAALGVGLLWAGAYLGLGLMVGGVGGGDLKLAVPLGVCVSAVAGIGGVLVAMAGAGALSTVSALRSGDTPHGPAMMGAAAITLALAVVPGLSLPLA